MSSGQVVSFFHRPTSCDWTQQELAEFYRVEDTLFQGGFAVTTDRGVTDEGDPWFVVCRADTEEVIAHFARIDREYVIASNLYPGAVRGRDFRALVREMLESHPLTLPIRRHQGQNVLLHPATLLVALLATAYIVSGEKELVTDGHVKSASIASLLIEKFAIFAAAILAATWLDDKADWALNAFEKGPLSHLFHDDKAAVAAAHDAAPLDTVSHNSPGPFDGHRSDQTNQVLALNAQGGDSTGQEITLKAVNSVNAAHNSSENTSEANMAPPDHTNNDDQASAVLGTGGHNDYSNLGSINPQAPITVGTVAAAAAAASQPNAAASQGNSLDSSVVATDAYHLTASEISSFSTPTVVLSTVPVPVNVALDQAFLQVGLGSAPTHDAGFSGGTLAFVANNTVQPVTSDLAPESHLSAAESHPNAAEPQPSTVPVPTVAPSSSGPGFQAVQQAVEQFLASTPSAEVTLSGDNVVIIDTNVADAKSPNYGVVTYEMSDGSTLSLVGISPSHLHTVSA